MWYPALRGPDGLWCVRRADCTDCSGRCRLARFRRSADPDGATTSGAAAGRNAVDAHQPASAGGGHEEAQQHARHRRARGSGRAGRHRARAHSRRRLEDHWQHHVELHADHRHDAAGRHQQQMGVTVPAGTSMQLRNVASVMITAQLPPFAHPHQRKAVHTIRTGTDLDVCHEMQANPWRRQGRWDARARRRPKPR